MTTDATKAQLEAADRAAYRAWTAAQARYQADLTRLGRFLYRPKYLADAIIAKQKAQDALSAYLVTHTA